jgi:hypothetical protein
VGDTRELLGAVRAPSGARLARKARIAAKDNFAH